MHEHSTTRMRMHSSLDQDRDEAQLWKIQCGSFLPPRHIPNASKDLVLFPTSAMFFPAWVVTSSPPWVPFKARELQRRGWCGWMLLDPQFQLANFGNRSMDTSFFDFQGVSVARFDSLTHQWRQQHLIILSTSDSWEEHFLKGRPISFYHVWATHSNSESNREGSGNLAWESHPFWHVWLHFEHLVI